MHSRSWVIATVVKKNDYFEANGRSESSYTGDSKQLLDLSQNARVLGYSLYPCIK